MPIRGVDHIDLAVSDVDRSLAFYLGMLGPIGLAVEGRFRTYRGTEEVVYLGFGQKTSRAPSPKPGWDSGRQTAASIATSRSGSSTSRSRWTVRAKSMTPTSAA